MTEIMDMYGYVNGMQKSMLDKLFFLDKIDNSVETIIDYGCADGTLMRAINKLFPGEYDFVGVDNSNEMLELAKQNMKDTLARFFSSMDEVMTAFTAGSYDPNYCCLNMSSVIHEIFSYWDDNKINKLYRDIRSSNIKYITIRDMCLSSTAVRQSSIEDQTKVYRYCSPEQLSDFENAFGSISNNKNLIHFLMKYRYLANWDRECRENYFPIDFERLIRLFSEYELIYCEHYILPFVKNRVKDDFNIDLKDNTHVKLIFKRKGYYE